MVVGPWLYDGVLRGNDVNNRRGTRKEGKDSDTAARRQRKEAFDGSGNRNGRRRRRSLRLLGDHVCGRAERAVVMGDVAVGVSMGDLDGGRDENQKNTGQSKQDSQRA